MGAIVIDGATNYGQDIYEVDCITLDSLDVGDRDVVIKIDVEGREGGVIAGARELLKGKAKLVVMEYHQSVIASTGTDVAQLFSDFADWGFDPFICGSSEVKPSTFAELLRQDVHMNIALKRRMWQS